MKRFFQLLGVALMASILTLAGVYVTQDSTTTQSTPTAVVQPTHYAYNRSNVSSAPTDFIEAAEKSIYALVHVKNTAKSRGNFSALDYFYGRSGGGERVGMGSGVIVSPDGFIVTNNHVIEGATKIEVTTNDNVRYTARLIGTDPLTDIAVLKIDPSQAMPYLTFGNSDQTRIGEWVLAIGNPFNLNSTVTAGIISAKSRDLNERDQRNQSFIQTDAAVNSGNSGGALVNTQGELVGINTAITTFSGGFEGYSFAVPSNIARKVFEDLIEYGSTQKGLLGVRGTAITPEIKENFDNITENEGFYVSEVMPGMGAAAAGIQTEDILLRVDGVKLKKFSDLTGYLETKRPGDKVQVELSRNGEIKTLTVALKKNINFSFLEMQLRNLNAQEKEDFGTEQGVIVDDPGNYFKGEIEAGSVIVDINGDRIESVDDLQRFSPSNLIWITYITPDGDKIRLRL